MSDFDEEKQNKQLEDLRKEEEEQLVQVLAESKYNDKSLVTTLGLYFVPIIYNP